MTDLPNGFVSLPKRGQDFESAGDAIRRSQRDRAKAQQVAGGAGAAAPRRADMMGAARSAQTARANVQQPARTYGAGTGAAGGAGQVTLSPFGMQTNVVVGDNPVQMEKFAQVEYAEDGTAQAHFDQAALDAIDERDRRGAWVEIDLSAVRYNTMVAKQAVGPGKILLAVVKADAYGHGAVQVAKMALNSGAEYLGVATVDEAIELRNAGIFAPVLILSEPPIHAIPLLLGYRVMPTVYTPEFAIQYGQAAASMGLVGQYHLKINTGMNRIGVHYSQVIEFLRQVTFHPGLELVGTFTHFATADEYDTMEFERALRRFEDALAQMRAAGVDPGIVHAANSAAIFRFPRAHFDMVRLGICLYGVHPSDVTRQLVNLRPVMSVHARITDVKSVPVGEGVSYGLRYQSRGYNRICTLPIGYADGLRRGLSDKLDVIMGGQAYPQVGSICMDQCMFEVSQKSRPSAAKADPQIGDTVTILGACGNAENTLDGMAAQLGTIPYEVAIGFGCSRLPRIYV
jgi:alanine racemase